jgi:hypothetical protein
MISIKEKTVMVRIHVCFGVLLTSELQLVSKVGLVHLEHRK